MATVHKTELLKMSAALIMEGHLNPAEVILAELGKYEIENVLFDNLGEYNSNGMKLDKMPKTFGEMHDFCDANELGGLCTVLISESFALRFGSENEDCMSEEEMAFANRLQDRLHKELVNGNLKPTAHTFI